VRSKSLIGHNGRWVGCVVSFVFSDVIGCAGVMVTLLLDEGAVTTGAVSKGFKVLPMGETVATGSVCILDTALTIEGTATVGNTCVTGCMTAGIIFLTDILS